MDQFKTRDKANEGVRIPLSKPGGAPTEHWLIVRSAWSDEFQFARNAMFRDAVEESKAVSCAPEAEQGKLRREFDRKRRAKAVAALIAEWSFDETECSEQSKIDFLLDAPQVLAMVEHIAEDDKRFFGQGWTSSSSGEKQK
tara:strand:- start:398 stop:820 length:423 start_codon:yes stop_codon:yes gene_type:complete